MYQSTILKILTANCCNGVDTPTKSYPMLRNKRVCLKYFRSSPMREIILFCLLIILLPHFTAAQCDQLDRIKLHSDYNSAVPILYSIEDTARLSQQSCSYFAKLQNHCRQWLSRSSAAKFPLILVGSFFQTKRRAKKLKSVSLFIILKKQYTANR